MKIVIGIIIILAIVVFVAYGKRNNISKKVISAINIAGLTSIQENLNRQVSFTSDVVGYFKGLNLNPANDLPFLIDCKVLSEKLQGIPNKENSLLIGVYHKDSDSITNTKYLIADSFDTQTKEVLSKAVDGVVTLS